MPISGQQQTEPASGAGNTPVTGTVTVTDGAGPLTVDGTVGVSGSVAVTGPLTDTQLRATPVPVAGSINATDAAQKAEDSVAASGDLGNPILGVRNDAATAQTSADGDYGMIALDSAGRVGIADLGGSVTVDVPGVTVTEQTPIAPTTNGLLTRAMVEPSLVGELGILGADRSVFGAAAFAQPVNQLDADFTKTLAQNLVTSTVAGGGSTAVSAGLATMTTGAGVTSSARLQHQLTTKYRPGREMFALFTTRFTTPTSAASNQRIGLFDDNDGFFVGYQGTAFGFTRRRATVDTFVALTAANGDPLDGSASSRFTSGQVPVAINHTNINIWRIRFGWLGASVVRFEVQSPDGVWVLVHTIRYPNSATAVSITTTALPIRAEVVKAASDATSLVLGTASWAAGIVADTAGLEPAQTNSRVHVEASLAGATASGVIYTVTAGRSLRVTTIIISSRSNNNAISEGRITDGEGGAIRVPLVNDPDGGSNFAVTFPEPIRFGTSVYYEEATGDATTSIAFVGYEEST